MGYAGSHPLQVLITWWVSWLHHCKLFQSPCLQDRCWWTHPCCKHLSGISRSLSSPWESRSCGIFWPPPGTKELRYEFTFFSLKHFSSPGHSLVKLSFQLGHLGSLLKFPEAVPEGCSCLAPSGVFLTQGNSSAGRQKLSLWLHLQYRADTHHCRQGEPKHTSVGTSALLWLSQAASSKIPTWFYFMQSLYFPLCHLLFWSSLLCRSEQTTLQPLPAHLIFTFLLLVSSAAPCNQGVSAGKWGLAPAIQILCCPTCLQLHTCTELHCSKPLWMTQILHNFRC